MKPAPPVTKAFIAIKYGLQRAADQADETANHCSAEGWLGQMAGFVGLPGEFHEMGGDSRQVNFLLSIADQIGKSFHLHCP